MLTTEVRKRLDDMDFMIRSDYRTSHHHPADFPKTVGLFVDLIREHGFVHLDDVKDWAVEKGWSENDARDLAQLCDVVYYTLRYVGVPIPD